MGRRPDLKGGFPTYSESQAGRSGGRTPPTQSLLMGLTCSPSRVRARAFARNT